MMILENMKINLKNIITTTMKIRKITKTLNGNTQGWCAKRRVNQTDSEEHTILLKYMRDNSRMDNHMAILDLSIMAGI